MAKQDLQRQILNLLQQFFKKQQRKKPKSALSYLWVGVSGLALVILAQWGGNPRETSPKDVIAKGVEVLCQVNKIYDGDTVDAQCDAQRVRIRLVGIDAPEMKQAPYGQRAKEALQRHLSAKHFTLRSGGADFYQRTLGELFVNQRNINLLLVEEGYAVAYADKSTPKKYREAEAQAKRKRLGIWAEEGLQQDPKQWRRHCKDQTSSSPAIQC